MKIFLLAVLPIAPHNAFAWGWGPGWLVGAGEHVNFYYHQPGLGVGAYSNGYYAGQQDAIYDHDNNLAYNPIGECLSCHSELYWSGFHRGYNIQWNSYQAQQYLRYIYEVESVFNYQDQSEEELVLKQEEAVEEEQWKWGEDWD